MFLRNSRLRDLILTFGIIAASMTGCSKNEINQPTNEAANQSRLKATGIAPGIADLSFEEYNRAFMYRSGSTAYYKNSISSTNKESSWGLCIDMQGAMDACERTGRADYKTLVTDLFTNFLANNPTSGWAGDLWNDDLGWYSLGLVRAYMLTGKTNANFLTQAKYAFDIVWSRGWDTQYNGGGIWELQPEACVNGIAGKNPLAVNSNGLAAAMIYQACGDHYYYDRAMQIYDWSWWHLFDANLGLVYGSLEHDGTVNKDANLYNQGTWLDYANTMHNITGNANYLRDAQKTADFGRNNMYNSGIISNTSAGCTWAAEYARGLGHLCKDNNLYGIYGDWMVQNANSIWNSRRTDYNITDNAWSQKTSSDNTISPTKFVSAVAWMQFTPMQNNTINSGSTYVIVSKNSGKVMDVAGGSTTNNAKIDQWGFSNSNNQRWVVTSLGSNAYSIKCVNGGLFLDIEGGSTANGANIIQYGWNGGNNQRWYLNSDGKGYFTIVSVASGKAIDVSGASAANGASILQWTVSGSDNQKWSLVAN